MMTLLSQHHLDRVSWVLLLSAKLRSQSLGMPWT